MNKSKTNIYTDRINAVVSYIYEHLEEDLSLEKLSEIACFSKFHFHRQFSIFTGVNLHKFVKLIAPVAVLSPADVPSE